MKTRLLLLLIAAATLCGCDRLGHRLTYYTYINATDKTVVVTLYDQDFYTDDWKVEVNPDAKEVFRFVIARENNTPEYCSHIRVWEKKVSLLRLRI